MSDYRVTLKVTNARIKRAMAAAGIDTVAELCRRMGNADKGGVGLYVNLKEPARKENGEWRSTPLKIAEALNCMPEDLFSPRQQISGLKKTVAERDFEEGAIEGFLAQTQKPAALLPDLSIEKTDASHLLNAALALLKPREEWVIRARYGLGNEPEQTQEDLARRTGQTKSRIQQIESRALRKLRLYAFTGQLPREIVGSLIE